MMLSDEEIKKHLLSAEKTPYGYRPLGSPFIIILKNPRCTLEELTNLLSSGGAPFQIVGISSPVSPQEYIIYGTDLVTGCPIEMEVTPKWITIHLRRIPGDNNGDDCVKTLKRLFQNIKKHIDPTAELTVE